MTRKLATRFASAILLAVATPLVAQKPTIFDVADVVVGARRIQTVQLYAVGRWADADSHVGALSTEIQCFKALNSAMLQARIGTAATQSLA
jgi:hypothetical protein